MIASETQNLTSQDKIHRILHNQNVINNVYEQIGIEISTETIPTNHEIDGEADIPVNQLVDVINSSKFRSTPLRDFIHSKLDLEELPIVVTYDELNQEYAIIDGHHRIVRAAEKDIPSITAIVLKRNTDDFPPILSEAKTDQYRIEIEDIPNGDDILSEFVKSATPDQILESYFDLNRKSVKPGEYIEEVSRQHSQNTLLLSVLEYAHLALELVKYDIDVNTDAHKVVDGIEDIYETAADVISMIKGNLGDLPDVFDRKVILLSLVRPEVSEMLSRYLQNCIEFINPYLLTLISSIQEVIDFYDVKDEVFTEYTKAEKESNPESKRYEPVLPRILERGESVLDMFEIDENVAKSSGQMQRRITSIVMGNLLHTLNREVEDLVKSTRDWDTNTEVKNEVIRSEFSTQDMYSVIDSLFKRILPGMSGWLVQEKLIGRHNKIYNNTGEMFHAINITHSVLKSGIDTYEILRMISHEYTHVLDSELIHNDLVTQGVPEGVEKLFFEINAFAVEIRLRELAFSSKYNVSSMRISYPIIADYFGPEENDQYIENIQPVIDELVNWYIDNHNLNNREILLRSLIQNFGETTQRKLSPVEKLQMLQKTLEDCRTETVSRISE